MDTYLLTVKGIIRRGENILIVKRSESDDHLPGVWETVGGGMEGEGTPQESLRREVLEEAGLNVEVGEPFHVFTFRKDTGEFKIGMTFLCDAPEGEVVLSHEHSEYRWIRPEAFPAFRSIPSLYDEIARYAECVKKKAGSMQ